MAADGSSLPRCSDRHRRDEFAALVWDGERLFQAAKFGTEMQYQHLVFEEFARKIQPDIDVFVVPDGYHADINPSIVAEFAHVVYRFGHSMLTETVDRLDAATFNNDRSACSRRSSTRSTFDDSATPIADEHRRRRHHPRHDAGRSATRSTSSSPTRCATSCSACRSTSRRSTWRAAAIPACRR